MEFPSGAVPLQSNLYIERPSIEGQAYAELERPGSLIRIRAPKGMGKRSLLLRLLHHAKTQNYQQVSIDFQSVDEGSYASLSKFLRWFCAEVSRQLHLPPYLNQYWDDDIGAKLSCTIYFEDYLLPNLSALVIALNQVERVFEHPNIAAEFLPMLRYWHEYAKQSETFQKVRLVVSHATEIYVPLKINQSPFNIGFPIQLPPFTLEQVQNLALRHGINWSDDTPAKQLMAMVGGHPHLVRMALYHLQTTGISLTQLLAEAATQSGIYRQVLQQCLVTLQEQPELASSFRRVVTAKQPVELDPIHAYRLDSLGIVKLRGDRCELSCELYRQYFGRQNLEGIDERSFRLVQLERENSKLQRLAQIDGLTQVANRRSFDQGLTAAWNRMIELQRPLSVLLLDIDCFKLYNDTYGHQAGDHCLRQVAQAIQNCAQRSSDLVARYGGEEFALVLPQTPAQEASHIANKIVHHIRSLELVHESSPLPKKVVTLSIGIAGMVPTRQSDAQALVKAADKALYQSKRAGRDRYTIYSEAYVA